MTRISLLAALLFCSCAKQAERLQAVKLKYPKAEVIQLPDDEQERFLIRTETGEVIITDTFDGPDPKPVLIDTVTLFSPTEPPPQYLEEP